MITQLLADLSGMTLSKAAIARQMQRMGKRLEEMTRLFGVQLKLSDSVHMDETSWRVDGKNHWLWALMNSHYTLFHVDKSRGAKVVKELLGEVYGGTLHTDFYSAYGEIDCKKQKCLVHLLRELRDTAKTNEPFAKGPLCGRLKRLIKEMLVLKKRRGKLAKALYDKRGRRLEQRLKQLAAGAYGDDDSRRIANRLRKHEKELTLFLWDDAVSADNNLAERGLRPAVIMRKITGGSRSERGAKATAILLSITRTIRQHDMPLLETFKNMLMASWASKPFEFPAKPQPDSS
jgi:transposase